MRELLFSTVVAIAITLSTCTPTSTFECGGCVLLITEMEAKIRLENPNKKIEVGSFRLSPKGEQLGIQQVHFARSEAHLNEILDSSCEKSKEYKRVVNPLTGKAVYVQKDVTYLKGDEDSTMRSKLHSACNDLVDSHEDDVIQFLRTERDNAVKEFCQQKLGVCTSVDIAALPPNEPPAEELPPLDDEL